MDKFKFEIPTKEIEPLFIRYDKSKIEEERDLLKQNN